MEPTLLLQAKTYTDKTAAIAETERITLQYGGTLLNLDTPSGLIINISLKLPIKAVRQWMHALSTIGLNFTENGEMTAAGLSGYSDGSISIVLQLNFMGSSSGFQMPGPFA